MTTQQYIERMRRSHSTPHYQSALSWLRLLIDREIATVAKPGPHLDYGCGDGFVLSEVRKLNRNVALYGVDPRLAEYESIGAMLSIPGAQYRENADFLPAGSMATVTCLHVLGHCDDPKKTLVEIRSKLMTWGFAMFVVPNKSFLSAMAVWNLFTGYKPDPTIKHWWNVDEFSDLVTDAGLEIVRHETIGEYPKGLPIRVEKLRQYQLMIVRKPKSKVPEWECRRCKKDVDPETKRCGCSRGPSPWQEKPHK